MKDFIQRFSSRKFLLTLGLMIVLTLFPDIPDSVVFAGLSFIGAEGLRDVVIAWRGANVEAAKVELERTKVLNGWLPSDIQNNGSREIVSGKS